MELNAKQTQALHVLKEFSEKKLTQQEAIMELIRLGENPASATDMILVQSGKSDVVGVKSDVAS